MPQPTKFLLSEADIPSRWINLLPDLPGEPLPPLSPATGQPAGPDAGGAGITLRPAPRGEPLPPLSPATGQPAGPDDLTPIFPMGLIAQEVAAEPEVEIPDEVRQAYGLWRPTPLYRARRLEKALGTSPRIYYKYQGVPPRGPPNH